MRSERHTIISGLLLTVLLLGLISRSDGFIRVPTPQDKSFFIKVICPEDKSKLNRNTKLLCILCLGFNPVCWTDTLQAATTPAAAVEPTEAAAEPEAEPEAEEKK